MPLDRMMEVVDKQEWLDWQNNHRVTQAFREYLGLERQRWVEWVSEGMALNDKRYPLEVATALANGIIRGIDIALNFRVEEE